MDKKELETILKANTAELVTALKEVFAPAAKKEEQQQQPAGGKDDGKPLFKGDPTDTAALVKHAEALEQYELRKGVDFNDQAQVREYMTKLDALKKPKDGNAKKEDKGASNQGVGDGNKDDASTTIDGLSKEETDSWKAGQRIAEAMNKGRFALLGKK